MAKLNHGDKIKLVHEDGTVEYGEFHRYGASRYGAIAFFNGSMRFVDEQALIAVNNKCVNCVQVKAVPLKRFYTF